MQGMPIQILSPQLSTTGSAKSVGTVKPNETGAVENGFEGLLNQLMTANSQEKSLLNPDAENGKAATESAIIEHFQKNGVEFKPQELNAAIKLASTSTNLDELLNSLKNKTTPSIDAQLDPQMLEESGEVPANGMPVDEEATTSSPLDFLMKEGKSKDFGQVKTLGDKDPALKQFVSSEDFIGLRQEAKNSKLGVEVKRDKVEIENQLKNQDFSNFFSKNNNTEYAPKQSILADNLIRNTNDLAFGERKSKVDFDELKNPDMKIGSDLSMIKESFIPNVQSLNAQTETNVNGSEKILDLSKINSTNTSEIIKNISNYIEQNQVMNADTLDLNVKHDELGQFKIQVNKNVGPNNQAGMDLQIITSTTEGHEFFAKNEIGLIKTLSQAGIQLTDFKLVQSTENTNLAQGDSKHNQHTSGQTAKEFLNSNNGNSQQGSDRRKELWQEARDLQQRFGA